MKDAHCAETSEKSIFQRFELWLIVFTIYGDTHGFLSVIDQKEIVEKWPNLQERCVMN